MDIKAFNCVDVGSFLGKTFLEAYLFKNQTMYFVPEVTNWFPGIANNRS